MVLLLFGPPSCGKGTQAPLLSKLLGIPAISTGEMLRGECEAKSELGLMVQAVLSSGMLVGDHLVNQVMERRIQRPDCQGGFLLDGYPRTVAQAQFLNGLLERTGFEAPMVIHLRADHKILMERACSRRYCPKCHRIYNLLFQPPKERGLCDDCREVLMQRSDDTEAVVQQRLITYEKLTAPVVSYYRHGCYHEVPADRKPEEIFQQIRQLVETGAHCPA